MISMDAPRLADHRTYLYVLACQNDRFYVGISHALAQRLSEHMSGTSDCYVQKHGFERFLMAWTLPHRELALEYEAILTRRLREKRPSTFDLAQLEGLMRQEPKATPYTPDGRFWHEVNRRLGTWL